MPCPAETNAAFKLSDVRPRLSTSLWPRPLSDTAPELTGKRGMLIKEACLGLNREVARYGSNHPIWATTQRPRYSSMAAPQADAIKANGLG